jgi:cell pole-organizing protein PopZ
MGDVSAEPSMEDILSSIKRIIAEDADSHVARPRRRAAAAPAVEPETAEDDILELSEPAPEPVIEPVAVEAPAPVPVEPVVETPAQPPETIVSEEVAEASRARLDTLSRLIVKPEMTGSDTLEGLVREMLKPMLREWLDANLPELVETMVAKEIARITGQR